MNTGVIYGTFRNSLVGGGGNTLSVNAAGNTVVSGGQILVPDGTAAAPSYSFTNSTNTGWYKRPALNEIYASANGVSIFGIVGASTPSIRMVSNVMFGWSSGDPSVASSDVILVRDSSAVLALRNGTTSQRFNVYRTFTDASNYNLISIDGNFASVGFGVTGQKAGTGADVDFYVGNETNALLYFRTNANTRWQITAAGHFLANTDAAYDFGASGATRPRDMYVARATTLGGLAVAGGSVALTVTPGAHTAVTTEQSSVILSAHTTAITGAIATYRDVLWGTQTYSGAFTVTQAIAHQFNGPLPGNSTLTNTTVADFPTFVTNGTTASSIRISAPTGAGTNWGINVILGASNFQAVTLTTLTATTINGAALSGTFTGAATFSGAITFSSAGTAISVTNNATISGTLTLGGKISTYNNIATAGWGVAAVQGSGRSAGAVAAVASVASYLVGAADGSFIVSMNVLVTTATTHSFTAECSYTDEGNTPRVVTFNFTLVSGTFQTLIVNTNGTVPYEGVPLHIRVKAATTITLRTQAAGVYTTVAYNVEGLIVQVS